LAGAEQRVFADLPDLETERLLLRKMRLDDAEAVFAYASDPEVTRYVLQRTLLGRNTLPFRATLASDGALVEFRVVA
jgi:hypothetical protein